MPAQTPETGPQNLFMWSLLSSSINLASIVDDDVDDWAASTEHKRPNRTMYVNCVLVNECEHIFALVTSETKLDVHT